MNIDQLKTELREFIKLSETITLGECRIKPHSYALFIARARNISPTMAKMLLVAVEHIEAMSMEVNVECSEDALKAYDQDSKIAQETLRQILKLWEETK
jgi:hypothetical protein